MRILVIEDDPILSHHLQVQLSAQGNQVQVALTAKEGFYQATNYPIDAAIIDLGLQSPDSHFNRTTHVARQSRRA